MSLCPPVHRTFSDERGAGTFHSLGTLPKRRDNKSPVFHIAHDDDDDENASSLDEHHSVPFPRSTCPPSPSSSSSSPPSTPLLSRGASVPILLSNGKPLKSSLKSSSSSPAMLIPSQHMHLRARSEPSTPATTPKNVHFPDKDYALATVCVFNCKARPAALSNPTNGNGDETETEGEDTPPTRFPFPRMPLAVRYEIDPTKSSIIHVKYSPLTNLLLESLDLSSSSHSSPGQPVKPLLTGSILVRNLAFEKHIAIRFTVDDWQTVSEVSARYSESLSEMPSHISRSFPSGDSTPTGRGWDRFTFAIRLEDYAHSLSTRTMWLAARYRVTSTYPQPGSIEYGPGGEWWDNNEGKNYRIGFRPAVIGAASPKNSPRHRTISITQPQTQVQPPTTCKEHVLGLMVPSIVGNTEIEPMSETKRPSVTPRVGKLSLCNYVPPKAHVLSSITLPSPTSSQSLLPSMSTYPEPTPPATTHLSSDDDSTSPASSTLSTPSVSPTISPRVIIGGQPATYSDCPIEKDDVLKLCKPLHVADWEWSAPSKPRMEQLARQRTDLFPVSDSASSPGNGLVGDPLYDAFVTRWCFAQGPSPNHHGFGDGSIMM